MILGGVMRSEGGGQRFGPDCLLTSHLKVGLKNLWPPREWTVRRPRAVALSLVAEAVKFFA